jgi:DNA-binding CsgD family transcriptional regulator
MPFMPTTERRARRTEARPPTDRQLEMLRWAAQGLMYPQIAEKTSVKIGTVRATLHKTRKKLKGRDTFHAAKQAVTAGIIDPFEFVTYEDVHKLAKLPPSHARMVHFLADDSDAPINNVAIARRANLSYHTVRNEIHIMSRTLQVPTREMIGLIGIAAQRLVCDVKTREMTRLAR